MLCLNSKKLLATGKKEPIFACYFTYEEIYNYIPIPVGSVRKFYRKDIHGARVTHSSELKFVTDMAPDIIIKEDEIILWGMQIGIRIYEYDLYE